MLEQKLGCLTEHRHHYILAPLFSVSTWLLYFKLAGMISIKKYPAFPAFLWLSLQTVQTSGYEK